MIDLAKLKIMCDPNPSHYYLDTLLSLITIPYKHNRSFDCDSTVYFKYFFKVKNIQAVQVALNAIKNMCEFRFTPLIIELPVEYQYVEYLVAQLYDEGFDNDADIINDLLEHLTKQIPT